MNLVKVEDVATLGAVALTLTSEALSVVSEKGIIWEELGASLITGLSC